MRIKVEMKPVRQIIKACGVDPHGSVQMFVTQTINKYLTEYMPYRTGTLATKLKIVRNETEIYVEGPYARYVYYGKVMVGDPPKTLTNNDITYTKTKNAKAGPFWDRRMMAEQRAKITAEVQKYADRKRI